MVSRPRQLTRFPSGSASEIIRISGPLMLNALSVNLMMFCDRLILTKYDINAMTAIAGVTMVLSVFQFCGVGITSIAEVFVGQHNGAGRDRRIAEPVWQMIWFALLLNFIYWPSAYLFDDILLAPQFREQGTQFFHIMMGTIFLSPLCGAIASFYIGRGQVKMVTIAVIVSNSINMVLNYCLILGVNGIIEPMGAKGAAIGTSISLAINFLIMFIPFLFVKANTKYRTWHAKLKPALMIECLRIGFPNAIAFSAQIAGWTFLTYIIAGMPKEYIIVSTIAQSFYMIYEFANEGVQKAISAITSNFIGANHINYAYKTMVSAFKILLGAAAFLFLPYILFPDMHVGLFLDAGTDSEYLWHQTRLAMVGVMLVFFFDGVSWMFSGILTAGGDTKYIMYANIASVWLFAVIPAYIWLNYFPSTPSTMCLFIFPAYTLSNFIMMYYRFKSKKWIKLNLSEEPA